MQRFMPQVQQRAMDGNQGTGKFSPESTLDELANLAEA